MVFYAAICNSVTQGRQQTNSLSRRRLSFLFISHDSIQFEKGEENRKDEMKKIVKVEEMRARLRDSLST